MDSLTAEELDLLGLVAEKPELQPLFFRKAKGLKWFGPLMESGFLDPKLNPKPVPSNEEGYVNIPFWPVTEFLVSASTELREQKYGPYAKKFLVFILSTTAYARENRYGNYRTWWQFSKILHNIPSHLVALEDLKAIDYWLEDPYEHGLVAKEIGETWLNALLDEHEEHARKLALGVLEIVFKIEPHRDRSASGRRDMGSRISSWYEKRITEKVAEKAGTVLGVPAVALFRDRLEHLLTGTKEDKWSSVWRRAIEDHEQDQYSEGNLESIIVNGFRDSLSGCIRGFPHSALEYVENLLESAFQTNVRIALYAIDKHYLQLNLLIDKALTPALFESNYRHEMWHLIRNHYGQLTQQQREKVLAIIGEQKAVDEKKNLNRTASAYYQAIWYAAIKDLGNEEARLYASAVEIAGSEPEHPDFSSYSTVGWGGRESPISTEDLLSMEVDQLIGRLNSVTDDDDLWKPGIGGLAKALKEAIKAKPLRYYETLDRFVDLDLAYNHEVISAYHELWSNKVTVPWDDIWPHLLSFCRRLVEQDSFWEEAKAQSRRSFVANRHWIVGDIARLIEDGVKSDEHAFSPELLATALAILCTILERQEGEEFKGDADAVMVAINSPRGRTLEALVNLSLRTCRLADKQGGGHEREWEDFERLYSRELERSNQGEYEFVTLVSLFLPNFLYLSKTWTLGNLGQVFDQANLQKWRCAIEGYAHVGLVYDEIYDHLESHGDFLRALDDQTIRTRVREKIVQNIVVKYLSVDDPDSVGLLTTLLERNDFEELSQLVWFCWTHRDAKEQRVRDRVLLLWPRILAVIDLETKEGRKIASRLSSWIAFVNVVDESNKGWLLAVAPYADEGHGGYGMLEGIARLSRTQPVEAWEVWMKMLTRSRPDYPDEAIGEALRNLVKLGMDGQRKAKAVVDQYLKLGNAGPAQHLARILQGAQSV